MDERFQQLRVANPEFVGDHPPWGLATEDDFTDLTEKYGLRYPPSFVLFQSKYAAVLPSPDNALCWVKRGLLADSECGHFSIEHAIAGARQMGVPHWLAPFWWDEGNFACFDTMLPGPDGEPPVELWDHDAGRTIREAANFIEWLTRAYHARR